MITNKTSEDVTTSDKGEKMLSNNEVIPHLPNSPEIFLTDDNIIHTQESQHTNEPGAEGTVVEKENPVPEPPHHEGDMCDEKLMGELVVTDENHVVGGPKRSKLPKVKPPR